MLSSWVYAAVLFGAAVFHHARERRSLREHQRRSGAEKVLANSPYSLFGTTATLVLIGVLMVGAIFGQAAPKTSSAARGRSSSPRTCARGRTSSPLPRRVAVLVRAVSLHHARPDGGHRRSRAVRLDPARRPRAAAVPVAAAARHRPHLFAVGALFFTLAALTRRMAPVYVGMVIVVLGYFTLVAALNDEGGQRTLAALLDRSGHHVRRGDALLDSGRAQQRARPGVGPAAREPRHLVAVGAALLALAVFRFRPMVEEQKGARADTERASDAVAVPRVEPKPTAAFWLRTSLSGGVLYLKEVLRSPVYWTLVVAGLAILATVIALSGKIYGTPTLPVTYSVLEAASGAFSLFTIIVVAFYGGDLVWRERDAQLAEVADASRSPNWVTYLSKFFGLWLVAVSLQGIIGVCALASQIFRGFYDVDLHQYAVELLLIGAMRAIPLCTLVVVAQVLIGHKYLGHAAVIGYWGLNIVLRALGVEERLFRWGSEPTPTYSDMNGFGHGLQAIAWYRGWWWALSAAALIVGLLFVQRGRETSRRERTAEAKRRMTKRTVAALAVCLSIAALCAASSSTTRTCSTRTAPRTTKRRTRRATRRSTSCTSRSRPRASSPPT